MVNVNLKIGTHKGQKTKNGWKPMSRVKTKQTEFNYGIFKLDNEPNVFQINQTVCVCCVSQLKLIP